MDRLNVEFRKTVTWDLCHGQRSKNIGPKGAWSIIVLVTKSSQKRHLNQNFQILYSQ